MNGVKRMIRSTGIIRPLDELGRVVLPKELRVNLNLNTKDKVEIFVDDEGRVILKKYEASDIFTGVKEDLIEYKGKKISVQSVREILEKMKEEGIEL